MKAKLNDFKASVVEWTCFALFVVLEVAFIYWTFRSFGVVK